MNRYAFLFLVLLVLAGIAACGSAEDDPAQRAEKPNHVPAMVPAKE